MPKKTLSPEDLDLFQQTVGSVKPVDNNKIEPHTPKPSARINKKKDFQHEMLSETTDWDFQIQSGDSLQYLATGLQRRLLKKLRKGLYRVDDELDLHGMNVKQAYRSLNDFLHHAGLINAQCVRVIHGKGHHSDNNGPVLKTKVGGWLQRRKDVLAYHSALPHDGGTGALYVLLERSTSK